MSRSVGPWPWTLALGLMTAAFGVRAQAVGLVAVEWSAPPGCPGANVVEQRVTELAGAISRSTPLNAKGHVSVVEGGVTLHLETLDAGQTFVRDVELPTCEQAAETAALILAMALRAEVGAPLGLPAVAPTSPNTSASLPPSSPAPPPPAPSLVAPTRTETPPPAVQPARTGPTLAPGGAVFVPPPPGSTEVGQPPTPSANAVRQVPGDITAPPARGVMPAIPTSPRVFAASVAGSVVWGLVPRALWALTAHAAWLPLPWRFELTGTFAPSQRISLPSDADRGGEFIWWSAAARGCYALQQPRTSSSPFGALVCVGGEGGQLRGKAYGTTLREVGVSPWLAVNAGLGGGLALGDRVELIARMEVAAPLRRDRFVLENAGDASLVARPGLLLGKLSVGVEVEF